jgi:hypothetical protein
MTEGRLGRTVGPLKSRSDTLGLLFLAVVVIEGHRDAAAVDFVHAAADVDNVVSFFFAASFAALCNLRAVRDKLSKLASFDKAIAFNEPELREGFSFSESPFSATREELLKPVTGPMEPVESTEE